MNAQTVIDAARLGALVAGCTCQPNITVTTNGGVIVAEVADEAQCPVIARREGSG